MKRLFIIILVPLLAVALMASAKITFEKVDLEFGEIESGKVVDLEFKFENTGNETLIIKNISSGCGCTVSSVDKKEYAPGEKGIIPVKFFSRGYNGEVTKTVTVSTNDPENVYARLKISGNVTMKDFAEVEFVGPDQVEFNDAVLGKKYNGKVKIKNTGNQELKIIEVIHAAEAYPEFTKNALAGGEEYEINVVFIPMQAGKYASFIRLRTNAYKQRALIIKVSGEVKEKE